MGPEWSRFKVELPSGAPPSPGTPPQAFDERERKVAAMTFLLEVSVAKALDDDGMPQSLLEVVLLVPQVAPDSKAKIWVLFVVPCNAGSNERAAKLTPRPLVGSEGGDCITESMFNVGSNPKPN